MPRTTFHVSIHAAPGTGDAASRLASFDGAYAALERLPRMFIEPDGAFVWTGEESGGRWQLEGVLYDAGSALSHVVLRGDCPPAMLDVVLAALRPPGTPLAIHLLERGETADEAAFRRMLQGDTAARPIE